MKKQAYRKIIVVYKMNDGKVSVKEYEDVNLALVSIRAILSEGGRVLAAWGES